MCEYCENDGYYKRNKSLISKTLKNNVDIDLAINVKDKKLVASIENLTMNVEDNNWFLPTKKINYCPMCRKEAGRVTVGDLIKRLEKIDKDKMCIHREFKDSIGWANLAIEEKENEVTFYGDMSSPWSDE